MNTFPPTFTFGIADSDLQTNGTDEPMKAEGAQRPMWDVFAEEKKIDRPGAGSYRHTHTDQDAGFIKKLGVGAYRTSVSMSRTITPQGKVNTQAIEWYRNYLGGLKDAGIEIHLCLYHWEAPERFATDGVLTKGFDEYFLKHTDIVLEHLGDIVDYFIPMNELWCICYLSHKVGIHAPGRVGIDTFFKAYFAMTRLQTAVIDRLLNHTKKPKVGVVNIHFPTYIQTDQLKNQAHRDARFRADYLTNFLYSDPLFTGSLDARIVHRFRSHFPKEHKAIIRDAKRGGELSYYGVNFYSSEYVVSAENEFGYDRVTPEGTLTNSLGWPLGVSPNYPDGLEELLLVFHHRYKPWGLQSLIVSENGTPEYTNLDSQEPQDHFRIYYVQEHLRQIQSSMRRGVEVDGYFLWTLLDNYEWQEGYSPESSFGIIGVDRNTGKRVPKKSYQWYQKFIHAQKER